DGDARDDRGVLLAAQGITKTYPGPRSTHLLRRRGTKLVVDDVDLSLRTGETTAILGESGAGKSTLGRMLLRLEDPDRGSLHYDGQDLLALRGDALRRWRAHAQMIFQDPFNSL